MYLGFQGEDDRHGEWNEVIYSVVEDELRGLRKSGYQIIIGGNMNEWAGEKIPGNNKRVNKNGERFVLFLERSDLVMLNSSPKTIAL